MAKRKNDWFSEAAGFFGKGYLSEYAQLLPAEKTQTEVNFLVKNLRLKKKVKILDLACGHGRHTVEFARRGFVMTGQDLNGFFLKEAAKAAKRAKVKVRWIKSDMRQIPFENEFDVVFNLFTAFGYFDSDVDHQEVINQVAKSLRRGGIFVIDTINRDRIMSQYRGNYWNKLEDGSIVLNEAEFDFVRGRNHERRTRIWKNGKRKESDIFLRMFTLPELIAMCEKAGLHCETTYGDYTGEEVSLTSKRYILIARKK